MKNECECLVAKTCSREVLVHGRLETGGKIVIEFRHRDTPTRALSLQRAQDMVSFATGMFDEPDANRAQ